MVHLNSLSSAEKIKHYQTLDSTNAKAWDLIEEGMSPPFWVVADNQTNGRGRHGREWLSAPGNLTVSTALGYAVSSGKLATLSLVTGLAVIEAIEQQAQRRLNLSLKWPNDIIAGGAKVGGILIEAEGQGREKIKTAIVGIGINIESHPNLENRKTASLTEIGVSTTRDALFAELQQALSNWLTLWDEGKNLKEIIQNWQARATPIGTTMTVKTGPNRIEGKFWGLDDQGALNLMLPDNSIKTITGGELL